MTDRNPKSYTKLRHMVELSQDKFFYVFPDEFCAETQSATRRESEKVSKTMEYYRSKIVGRK